MDDEFIVGQLFLCLKLGHSCSAGYLFWGQHCRNHERQFSDNHCASCWAQEWREECDLEPGPAK